MKKSIAALATLLLLALGAKAQTADAPAREMRSAWVATVWRLDWPQTVISSTGNQTQIQKQKDQMTQLLDSLSLNNFNAINFQVRSRADAMYRSSYEPWSSDLVDERGKDPGWDPLEWTVAECHRRGMECHAWLNPYRYESVAGQWDGTPGAYRAEHPDWLIDVKASNGTTASILNPGLPEVTERICDIIREIITNYDVDGVLFDDYFYLSGTNTTHDGHLYDAYKAEGGTLSIGDWRRDNVNRMIASVYSTIKSVKPWVRFGVSPAGIACTSSKIAESYGIPRCPTGSDWQYADIYSDPLAWISQQNLDFISPQIYWTIGHTTDYKKAAEWWSMVAHKWNRHVYVSHSISELDGSSRAPGIDSPERASGPNSGTFAEYVRQIGLNRQYNADDAPGSIFYSAKYLYRIAPTFSHYLRNNAFATPCLVPAMTWMPCDLPGSVENVSANGSNLSWDAKENMRYTVYAYPEGLDHQQMVRAPEYLLGVTYTNHFTVPAKYLAGYTLAVAALDRYGNESGLALPGQPTQAMPPVQVISPLEGQSVEAPFTFSWMNVTEASEFVVEIATDPQMHDRIDQRSVTGTSIGSDRFVALPLNQPLYWRVRACAPGFADGVSDVVCFNVSQLTITAPAHGDENVGLTPTFTYSFPDREVNLQIAATDKFEDADMVYTHTHTGAHTVADYALAGGVQYYARARHERAGETLYTPVVAFKTAEVAGTVPSVVVPADGSDFFSDQHIQVSPVAGPVQIRVELAASTDFPVRTMYFNNKVSTTDFTDTKTGGEIKISTKYLTDGATYYVRARATYVSDGQNINTEYSPVNTITYRAGLSGVENVAVVNADINVENGTITAMTALSNVRLYSVGGIEVLALDNMAQGQCVQLNVGHGVYVLCADGIAPRRIML